MAPLRARGVGAYLAPTEMYDAYVDTEALARDHAAYVFEAACRQYVGHSGEDALGFKAVQVGRWWDARDEADVVALDLDDRLLVGECKWGTFNGHDLDALTERAARVATAVGQVSEIVAVTFTRGDLTAEVKRAAATRGVRVVSSFWL